MGVKASKTRSCSRSTIIHRVTQKGNRWKPVDVHNLTLQRMAWTIKLDEETTTRIDLLQRDNPIINSTQELSTTIRNYGRAK
jgi:hypothetical protein